MADEVDQLVIAPFREIVDKGQAAIENANADADDASREASAPMLKAAQNLVKEGERALKRIEPLSTRGYDEYGCNFIDAIKENDEITRFRTDLEDLLWDFDDFITVDDFDADRFYDLQKASRKAAPAILDILKRMKLVAPVPTPPQSSRATSTTPDVPAVHAQPEQVHTSIIVDPPPQTTTENLMEETELQLSSMMKAVAGPDEGLEGNAETNVPSPFVSDLDRSNSHRSETSEAPSEPPPRPPSADPWQVGRVPPVSRDEYSGEGNRWERRPPVVDESPIIPQAQPVSPYGEPTNPLRLRRFDDGVGWVQKDDDDCYRMRTASQSHGTTSDGSRSPGQSHRWTNSTQGSTDSSRHTTRPHRAHSAFSRPGRSPSHSNESTGSQSQIPDVVASRPPSDSSSVAGHPTSIPENSAVNNHSHSPGDSLPNGSGFPPRQTSLSSQNSNVRSTRQPSTESVNSSVFDIVECVNPTSPATSGHRSSLQSTSSNNTFSSNGQQPPAYAGHTYPPVYRYGEVAPSRSSGTTITNHSSSTLTARPGGVETVQSPNGIDEGLIPVDLDSPIFTEPTMPLREPDCTIGPFSSFYKLKGFCKGAEEAMRGQLGFKKIKRPVGGFSMAVVAKCNHCLYELDYKSVEQDLNNDSGGSFTANSIGFRLRVLQKSHLQVRHVDEQLYGCLFCIQQGKTVEESDSTVFFNQKQLFAHMARHPRPLPAVPSLTVIEEPELPHTLKDNFDLHFGHPPIQSVMTGISREVARLPAAVSLESRKNQNGVMRTPPDRTPVLPFAIGARIVGIEFPPKYEGKWGIGWHDGVRAAFEAESIQLDAPAKNEIKMQGTSNIQAVARWRWNQKGDDKWLKFDKGDIIKNIGWAYADHWCWSGTTSKGWGIFPQSHLDPNSIRTMQPGDGSSVSSWEKKNPLRFSLRKNADRKFGSSASSENSLVPLRAHIY